MIKDQAAPDQVLDLVQDLGLNLALDPGRDRNLAPGHVPAQDLVQALDLDLVQRARNAVSVAAVPVLKAREVVVQAQQGVKKVEALAQQEVPRAVLPAAQEAAREVQQKVEVEADLAVEVGVIVVLVVGVEVTVTSRTIHSSVPLIL